ncbi:hypothetical protein QVD17_18664 [Tagetes erecta]|uniref:Uncharacterized protein n=1 Tax=Tagetes erecta TaxID=13708 RepID=A0AAD8NWM0_TARER|nr:hypothetical protein QVD17_18664 [Tagetes erecta]
MEEIQGFVISSCWRRLCSQEVQRVGVLLYAIVLPTIKCGVCRISYFGSSLLKEQAVVVIGADCNGSAFKKPCDYLPCLISQVITWRIKKRNPNGHNYGITLHARLEMKDTFDLTWCSNMGIYFAVKSKVHV